MPPQTWTLTDHARGINLESWRLGPEELGLSGLWIEKRTLSVGLSRGVEVIELNNGRLRMVILPTRGMGIWRAMVGDVQLGWKSPVRGPVHPRSVQLWEPSGIGWLDGFDEWLVRCGLESNGAPEFHENGSLRYPLHGRIANIPAHEVSFAFNADTGEMIVRGVVEESRLFGNKMRLTTAIATRAGEQSIRVTDTVTNLAAIDGEFELLYHINVGEPLLQPGATAVLPVAKLAPRDPIAAGNLAEWNVYGPQTAGMPEAAFFCTLLGGSDGLTHALLKSTDGRQGMSLRYDPRQLPCFTLWKNRMPTSDGYVTGFEPATNYPNRRSFEKSQSRVVTLPPGQSRTFHLELAAHADAASVAQAEAAVARLQAAAAPQVRSEPDPEWSPA